MAQKQAFKPLNVDSDIPFPITNYKAKIKIRYGFDPSKLKVGDSIEVPGDILSNFIAQINRYFKVEEMPYKLSYRRSEENYRVWVVDSNQPN